MLRYQIMSLALAHRLDATLGQIMSLAVAHRLDATL